MEPSDRADPLLDELDEVRKQMWDECDHDIEKYFDMVQEEHERLLREGWREAPPRDVQDKSAA